jgi:hypothetical protein
VKINTTVSDLGAHVGALLYSTPITAARHGLLGLIHDPLSVQVPTLAAYLDRACTPLFETLGVDNVYAVPAALRAMDGRPPRKVVAALRHPDVIDALCRALDQLGIYELDTYVLAWGPQDVGGTVMLSATGRAEREELLSALHRRAGEILATWTAAGVQWRPSEQVGVDGRAMYAAARAWQVPMINGEVLAAPESMAPRYANRIGKCAAAVAFSRTAGALRSAAPDSMVFEPMALVVAVGEAVSREHWREADRTKALHGYVGLSIPEVGAPVPDTAYDLQSWWPRFTAWGASGRREAMAIPTAWRLSPAQGDVVVWALSSAAVRLAVAASLPSAAESRAAGRGGAVSWEDHVASALPDWERGARNLWALVQSTRDVSRRTEFPGALLVGSDRSCWPWPPAATDMLSPVPVIEEV